MNQQETSGTPGQRTDHTAENFKVNMKKYREALGISLGELAHRMSSRGFSSFYRQTIQRIEDGERAVRLDEAFALSEILGKTVQQMTDSRMETDLLDALGHAEVGAGGVVLVAAQEQLTAQAALAEAADVMSESGEMPDDLELRTCRALAQTVVDDARRAVELGMDGKGRSGGKFSDYWICAQNEALSPLPGVRQSVAEIRPGELRYWLESFDLQGMSTEAMKAMVDTHGGPFTREDLIHLITVLWAQLEQIVKENPELKPENRAKRRKHKAD